jgi:L-glyceraldehyde 3-phosphate reductase
VPFIINQNRYSIFDRKVEQNGLLKATGELHKGLICFSPLAQGLLTDKYLHGIPEDSRIKTDGRFLKESALTPERLKQIAALNELALKRGQSLAEMALAWDLSHKEVTSVLIGASKPSQIIDNVKALAKLDFTPDELALIDKISL